MKESKPTGWPLWELEHSANVTRLEYFVCSMWVKIVTANKCANFSFRCLTPGAQVTKPHIFHGSVYQQAPASNMKPFAHTSQNPNVVERCRSGSDSYRASSLRGNGESGESGESGAFQTWTVRIKVNLSPVIRVEAARWAEIAFLRFPRPRRSYPPPHNSLLPLPLSDPPQLACHPLPREMHVLRSAATSSACTRLCFASVLPPYLLLRVPRAFSVRRVPNTNWQRPSSLRLCRTHHATLRFLSSLPFASLNTFSPSLQAKIVKAKHEKQVK